MENKKQNIVRTINETEKESWSLNTKNQNSLIPAIKESEKFIKFLLNRFEIENIKPYIVVINKTSKNALGTFANTQTKQHFINTTEEFNTITLNTLHIKDCNPYEVLTHELSHYVNYCNNIKDCSGNQYHNKHFKAQAEKLLLSVEKTKNGFSYTKPTEEFIKMLEEFKPNKEVFNIFQSQRDKKKIGSRLRLFICDCGIKVRVGSDDFNALCLDCNTEFKKVEK